MQGLKSTLINTLITATLLSASVAVHAEGMVPETSLLIIDEATHSGTINVKNTDSHPSLLYTNVVDLPDDTGLKLIATQPVVRLEPGQTQQLRFILQNKQPLDVEHYKRVTFDGIPPKNDDKKIKIGINIRQDIPVLIRPASLGVVTDAWKFLKWSSNGASVTVKNPREVAIKWSAAPDMTPQTVLYRRPVAQFSNFQPKIVSSWLILALFQANFLISGRSRLCPYQLVNSNQVRQGE
ncbi:fimbria/pilus chaperone family protein [Enterobacter kobei]|nr:fimbria/pilus chaperone family protein [Enterobacter kobei]